MDLRQRRSPQPSSSSYTVSSRSSQSQPSSSSSSSSSFPSTSHRPQHSFLQPPLLPPLTTHPPTNIDISENLQIIRTFHNSCIYKLIGGKHSNATVSSSLCLGILTFSLYMLSPMRDASAIFIGVDLLPNLTFVSTLLTVSSSVPIGWIFEHPEPKRYKYFKLFGLTRGTTQGTSLALFYRIFSITLLMFAVVFKLGKGRENIEFHGYVAFYLWIHVMKLHSVSLLWGVACEAVEFEGYGLGCARARDEGTEKCKEKDDLRSSVVAPIPPSSSSTSSTAFKRPITITVTSTRLTSLGFIGFGGTIGQLSGSFLTSLLASCTSFSMMLVISAVLLEGCARISVFVGRVMEVNWVLGNEVRGGRGGGEDVDGTGTGSGTEKEKGEESESGVDESRINMNVNVNANADANANVKEPPIMGSMRKKSSELTDTSLKGLHAYTSTTRMKRVGSTNSLNQNDSSTNLRRSSSNSNSNSDDSDENENTNNDDDVDEDDDGFSQMPFLPPPKDPPLTASTHSAPTKTKTKAIDDSFKQRLLRGAATILSSKLLVAIFTYNSLFASTTTLLSFQRAELIATRKNFSAPTMGSNDTQAGRAESDTAFLASINMVSSLVVMSLQATGLGAYIAAKAGRRGTLTLMPFFRTVGVLLLSAWYVFSDGMPPSLTLFLLVDEFTRVINLAVAKPVRESLWSGLSNEARYEAKPLVDTLANRWGGGSAAFLVQVLPRYLGVEGMIFGLLPIKNVLVVVIAVWWGYVSVVLGGIRNGIDEELKKLEKGGKGEKEE